MNTDKKQTRKSGGGEHKREMEQRMEELTERVLGAVFEVANELGCGFLEKVYERALVRELGARGIRAAAQAPMVVAYKGQAVGEYFADVLVEDVLVMELKCVERLGNEHMAQCLNYLKASGLEVCLLVNFQRSKVEWRRIVQTGMATDEQERQEEWPRMNTDKHG